MIDLEEVIGSGSINLRIRYKVTETCNGYEFRTSVTEMNDDGYHTTNRFAQQTMFPEDGLGVGMSIDNVADRIDRDIRDCVASAVIMSMFDKDYEEIEDFK